MHNFRAGLLVPLALKPYSPAHSTCLYSNCANQNMIAFVLTTVPCWSTVYCIIVDKYIDVVHVLYIV